MSSPPASAILSSTYIRSCVDAGDVAEAATALGRPHRLEGVVVRGDQRGRQLGFPTANLLTSAHAAVPADGVYAAWLARRGRSGPQRLPAAVSIGTNPTFHGRERRVEAYVLDFDDDLYGERLSLDFVAHLREQRTYDGIGPLGRPDRQGRRGHPLGPGVMARLPVARHPTGHMVTVGRRSLEAPAGRVPGWMG